MCDEKECFNPFFIRASVYCAVTANLRKYTNFRVSIPSSSGHQFTANRLLRSAATSRSPVSIPSSSGHQFTGWLRRSSYKQQQPGFQSLLHQGISLLESEPLPEGDVSDCFNPFFIRASVYWTETRRRSLPLIWVSIPSSSGHQFTVGTVKLAWWSVMRFQSLLHQGISLLNIWGEPINRRVHRFNPFFIRASVY